MKPAAYLHELKLRPLPAWITTLFDEQHAPPRFIAHAFLVADVAAQLVTVVHRCAPLAAVDAEVVILGAALHDIGKVLHPDELARSGHHHEQAGYDLLSRLGIPAHVARFTQTHGAWEHHTDLPVEDLLVALADTCWKGKRTPVLEEMIAARLAGTSDRWQVWLALDDQIEHIAADAPKRLLWQQQFSTRFDAIER